jgi:hypothetical protein
LGRPEEEQMAKQCIVFLIALASCAVCSAQNPVYTCTKIPEIEDALTTKQKLSRVPDQFIGMWINEKAAGEILDIRQDKVLWRRAGQSDTALISDIEPWADGYIDNVPNDTALHFYVKRDDADVFLYVEKTGARLMVRVSTVALVPLEPIPKDGAAPAILTTKSTTYRYKRAVASVR